LERHGAVEIEGLELAAEGVVALAAVGDAARAREVEARGRLAREELEVLAADGALGVVGMPLGIACGLTPAVLGFASGRPGPPYLRFAEMGRPKWSALV